MQRILRAREETKTLCLTVYCGDFADYFSLVVQSAIAKIVHFNKFGTKAMPK